MLCPRGFVDIMMSLPPGVASEFYKIAKMKNGQTDPLFELNIGILRYSLVVYGIKVSCYKSHEFQYCIHRACLDYMALILKKGDILIE